MRSEHRIVAVAGPVGGGKSTLVEGLAGAFDDSCSLHFDHYEALTETPVDCLTEEAVFERYRLPRLVADLQQLRRGEAVTPPGSDGVVGPAGYIFVELPLGRRLQEAAPLIDLLLWIDLPLDVALARKVRAFCRQIGDNKEASAFVQWLSGYLDSYLTATRRLLVAQRQRVAADADATLDGTVSVDRLLEAALRVVTGRFGG